jgi:ABC-type dipeptide/oligopeptide/nickel transport system permease subunit
VLKYVLRRLMALPVVTFIPASLAILLFSVGWNLIGDGLRDLLDPRTR